MARVVRQETFTIPINEENSNGVDLRGGVFAMIQFPAAMTGTTVTPQVKCNPSASWVNVVDSDGADIVMDVDVDRAVRIPDECFPCTSIRLVSSGAEGAARTIYAVTGD